MAVKPASASFPGAPLARWWSFEDRNVALGDVQPADLNFLTILLVEFCLLSPANDWYVVPLKQRVGTIRHLDSLRVIDSFGVVSEATPVIDASSDDRGWEVFTLDGGDSGLSPDGRLFYLPNSLHQAMESKPFESVSFLRDESANLVWAIENRYRDADGKVVNRHDEEAAKAPSPPENLRYWDSESAKMVERSEVTGDGEPGFRFLGPLDLYEPKSFVPAHFVPYVPRRLNDEGAFVLRRGRTQEDVSTGPQYKGILLGESKYISEESIPRAGVKVERIHQLARDGTGRWHSWRSRKRSVDEPRGTPGIRFDALRRP